MHRIACPICNEALDTICIIDNHTLTHDDIQAMEEDLIRDKDDPTVFYLNQKCQDISIFPRLKICRIGKCRTKQVRF